MNYIRGNVRQASDRTTCDHIKEYNTSIQHQKIYHQKDRETEIIVDLKI